MRPGSAPRIIVAVALFALMALYVGAAIYTIWEARK